QPLRPRGEVLLGGLAVREPAGALEHELHPEVLPRKLLGLLMADTLIALPFTTRVLPWGSTVPGKRRCTESYLRRCASVFVSVMSFTATNSRLDCFIRTAARITLRPIRPNPLMPTRTGIALAPGRVPSLDSS